MYLITRNDNPTQLDIRSSLSQSLLYMSRSVYKIYFIS